MAFSKSFELELNNLFLQRTHWLRQELGTGGAGKPPVFSRRKVGAGISKLQTIASDALAKQLAKLEFNEHVASRKNYHIKGYGPDDKKGKFEKWLTAHFKKRRSRVQHGYRSSPPQWK
jgi:hypothetical protein